MFSKKMRKKSIGKKRTMWLSALLMILMFALILGTAAPAVWAQDELEAKFIFETNFSDRDTGIQVFTDGDPWRKVTIRDPNGKKILDVKAKGKLKSFGLTELFSESNEPNYDEMSLEEIVNLFPAGDYEFKGRSVEGDTLEGTATLSHDLPCAPTGLLPAGPPAASVPNGAPVNISWALVTDILDIVDEDCTGGPITEGIIGAYQVVVENLETEKDFSIFLDGAATVITLPPQFVTPDSVYKFEVLAIQVVDGENGNQTIAEGFFCTGLAVEDCVLPIE